MLVATMFINDEITDELRDSLWNVVSYGSIPFLSTSDGTHRDDNRWVIETCDEDKRAEDPEIQHELQILIKCVMNEEVANKVEFHDHKGQAIKP